MHLTLHVGMHIIIVKHALHCECEELKFEKQDKGTQRTL